MKKNDILGLYVTFDKDNTTLYKILDYHKGYVYIDTQCGYIWEHVEYIEHIYDLDNVLL